MGHYAYSVRQLLTSLDLLLFSAFPELDSGISVASSFRLLFISKKTPYASGAYTNLIVQLLAFWETRERLFYFPTIFLESRLQPAIFHWQHFKTEGMRRALCCVLQVSRCELRETREGGKFQSRWSFCDNSQWLLPRHLFRGDVAQVMPLATVRAGKRLGREQDPKAYRIHRSKSTPQIGS